ncbi:holo-[acyl-carrier-protein] synthase [Halobacteriales archaeon SW_5_70_135]|nr:MAG: holo-[acyl-carrier-protein] synthase [Halobacteriales archaeon SW_5_70_135]
MTDRTRTVTCGTDLVAVDRVGDLVERFGDSFLERTYTEREVAYCRSRAVPAQHLAARWAAKEAAAKALPGENLVHGDVEVTRDGGRPRLVLHGRAAAAAGDAETAVSLSHDATLGLATAQVVVHGPRREGDG